MQIDWWTLGIQTINFLIVVWLLSRFLYRPVRRVIEAREASDRKMAEEAAAKAAAAEAAREDFARKSGALADARRHQEAELHKTMEAERQALLQEAQAKADALLSEARQTIDRERDEALQDLKGDILGLARDLAKQAMGPGTSSYDVLRSAATALDSLKDDDIAELGRAAAESGDGITVVTAGKLGDPLREEWRQLLTGRFGEKADVRFSTNPEILGGAELHFPEAVLGLSVAQRLKDAAAKLETAK